MSYNIDRFKLKHLALVIPARVNIKEYIDEKTRWEDPDECLVIHENAWSYRDNWEGLSMSGTINSSGDFVVSKLDCCGEGSGHDYEDALKPMLEEFKADIEAVTIWEGGDSILELKCEKGKITEREIDL